MFFGSEYYVVNDPMNCCLVSSKYGVRQEERVFRLFDLSFFCLLLFHLFCSFQFHCIRDVYWRMEGNWYSSCVFQKDPKLYYGKKNVFIMFIFLFPFFKKTRPVIEEFLLVYFVFLGGIYFFFPNHCGFVF